MAISTQSGWIALAGPYSTFPALTGPVSTDWLVIGGGFTGLSAARELAERCPGDRIILIDAKKIAQGATARNSGFNVGFDLPGFTRKTARRNMSEYLARTRIDIAGAQQNEQLIRSLGIDCDYLPTGFHYAVHDPANFAEASALADVLRDAGASAEVIEGDAVPRRFGTTFYRRALHIAGGGNGTLQPAKFAKALVGHMPGSVELYEDTPALDLSPGHNGGAVVTVPNGQIRARKVILALNGLLPRFGYKRFRMVPLTLTASLTRPLTAEEDAAIGRPDPWAVLCPIKGGTTARLTQDRRILIRNTAEYRPGGLDPAEVAARRQTHLLGLKRRFPAMTEKDIEFSWAGTMGGSRGYRFIFEEASPGVFLTACCNGNGVARLSMLGRLLVHYATGDQNDLLTSALALARPGLLPPDPFLRLGVAARFALDRRKAAVEI
jgi:glycine/D-amino acid oxidase-like deaminating enzyme